MITLTKEIIEKANDYIPLQRKHIWCRNVASVAIQNVTINGGEKSQSAFATPDRYEENTMARQMALASALAQNYLHVYDVKTVLQEKDYDEILSSHLVNQLERLKGDRDIRDKVFNILYDFGELKKMLNTEIYSRLGHFNDTLGRAFVAMSMSDPQNLEQMSEDLKAIGVAVSDYEKRKAGRVAGDTAKAEKAELPQEPIKNLKREDLERAIKILEMAGKTAKKKGEET